MGILLERKCMKKEKAMKKKTEKEIVPRRSKRRFVCHTFCPVCAEGIVDYIKLKDAPALLGFPEKKLERFIVEDKVSVHIQCTGLDIEGWLSLGSMRRIPVKVHETLLHLASW